MSLQVLCWSDLVWSTAINNGMAQRRLSFVCGAAGQVQGQESEAAEWQDEEEVRFPPHSNQDLLLIFWQP